MLLRRGRKWGMILKLRLGEKELRLGGLMMLTKLIWVRGRTETGWDLLITAVLHVTMRFGYGGFLCSLCLFADRRFGGLDEGKGGKWEARRKRVKLYSPVGAVGVTDFRTPNGSVSVTHSLTGRGTCQSRHRITAKWRHVCSGGGYTRYGSALARSPG